MTGDVGRDTGGGDGDRGRTGPEEGDRPPPRSPLEEIDPDLNIFALANGLDLYRDRSDRSDRVLEWYRDGMVRRARLVAVAGDRVDVHYGAARRAGDDGPSGWWPLEEGLDGSTLASTLRSVLASAVARANDLTRSDLGGD